MLSKKKIGLHKNFSGDLQKKKKKKKKRSSQKFFKFFKRSPQKNVLKFYQFKKWCCPRAEDRPIFEDLKPRGLGQGQGLDLRGQGQGLQNLFSRTSSRPRTSSRTPPLLISLLIVVVHNFQRFSDRSFVVHLNLFLS